MAFSSSSSPESTFFEAARPFPPLNFPFMGKGDRGQVPSAPLFKRLADQKKSAKWLADELDVSEQVVSNWRRRGNIPDKDVGRVAGALGITYEQYMRDAGRPVRMAQQEAA